MKPALKQKEHRLVSLAPTLFCSPISLCAQLVHTCYLFLTLFDELEIQLQKFVSRKWPPPHHNTNTNGTKSSTMEEVVKAVVQRCTLSPQQFLLWSITHSRSFLAPGTMTKFLILNCKSWSI